MRVLNAVIGMLQKVGITPAKMDAAIITSKAKHKTGLSDLEDNIHQEGMEQLVRAINERPITHFGKLSSTGFGVEALSNRLRLIEHLKKNPHIRDVKIERPIFIIGFPRTGTTLLQNLLDLSDSRRALPFWEISNPIPRAADPEKDLRIRQRRTRMRLALADFVVPEMKFIHRVTFDSREECWPLMISQFTVPNWDMTSRWPDYGKWMLQHDMTRSYEEYRKFLQVMVSRVPDMKLILKSSDHLWHLDTILKTFPDACIVWAHRDPSRSISSYCSMVALNWRLLYGKFNPSEVGPYIEDRLMTGVERALEVRKTADEKQFFDVSFNDLQDDPIKVINNITQHFKLDTVDNDALRRYLNTDRSDNKGKHSYKAAHFGVEVNRIRERYRNYMERFGIPES